MKRFRLLRELLWRNLGYCTTCTKTAFIAAGGGWIVAFAVQTSPVLLFIATAFACVLTVLWVAHLLVYTQKTIVVPANDKASPTTMPRRTVLRFARTLALAAIASAVPRYAFAMGSCGSCTQSVPGGECWRAANDGTDNCYRCRSCGDHCGDTVC
jgi:predicted SprT family Zn-dependent metalloprotease